MTSENLTVPWKSLKFGMVFKSKSVENHFITITRWQRDGANLYDMVWGENDRQEFLPGTVYMLLTEFEPYDGTIKTSVMWGKDEY